MNYFKFSVLYGTIYTTMGSLEYYYILLFMLLAIVQVDIGVNYVNKKIRERMMHVARKIKAKYREYRTRKSIEGEEKKKKRKFMHHGFAFDQERGNAPQVINSVRKGSYGSSTSMLAGSGDYSFLINSAPKQYESKTVYRKSNKKAIKLKIDDIVPIKEEDSKVNW